MMKIVVSGFFTLAIMSLSLTPYLSEAFCPATTRGVVGTTKTIPAWRTTPQTVVYVSEPKGGGSGGGGDNDSAGIDFSKITQVANRALEELPKYDAAQVQKNLQQDELGTRGEIYFLAQGALIVCIVAGGIPLVGDPVRIVLAPLILVTGVGLALLSLVDLGSDSLSPFPKPTKEGALKTTGVYSQMRHPMYSSVLCVMLGLALVTNSADRLILTVLLGYVLEVKSDKEEVFLMEQFGVDYSNYKVQVPEKFLPVGLLKILPWTD